MAEVRVYGILILAVKKCRTQIAISTFSEIDPLSLFGGHGQLFDSWLKPERSFLFLFIHISLKNRKIKDHILVLEENRFGNGSALSPSRRLGFGGENSISMTNPYFMKT
jgi:hypothetical protein